MASGRARFIYMFIETLLSTFQLPTSQEERKEKKKKKFLPDPFASLSTALPKRSHDPDGPIYYYAVYNDSSVEDLVILVSGGS